MTDIDFDELDRAVNSLMSGTSQKSGSRTAAAPTSNDDQTPKVEIISPIQTSEQQESVAPEQPQSPPSNATYGAGTFTKYEDTDKDTDVSSKHIDEPTPTLNEPSNDKPETLEMSTPIVEETELDQTDEIKPSPEEDTSLVEQPLVDVVPRSLAAKRGGRFMDMVPTGATARLGVPKRTSRTGLSLSPLSTARTEDASTDVRTERKVAPIMDMQFTPVTSPKESPERSNSDLLQSILSDEISASPDADTDTAAAVVVPEVYKDDIDPANEKSEEIMQEEPLLESSFAKFEPTKASETPFISDAKENKRPLGGIQIDIQDNDAGEFGDVEKTAPEEPTDFKQPIPAELGNDLLKVESDGSRSHTTETAQTTPRQLTVQNDTTKQNDPDSAPGEVRSGPFTSSTQQFGGTTNSRATSSASFQGPSTRSTPSISQSIATHLAEPMNADDKHHEALYDSASIAQPLAHPAKQRSGLFILIAIVLLMVLGAAAAVFLTMSGII